MSRSPMRRRFSKGASRYNTQDSGVNVGSLNGLRKRGELTIDCMRLRRLGSGAFARWNGIPTEELETLTLGLVSGLTHPLKRPATNSHSTLPPALRPRDH